MQQVKVEAKVKVEEAKVEMEEKIGSFLLLFTSTSTCLFRKVF